MTDPTPPAVSDARAEPAAPSYALGQIVIYVDRQGRCQQGEIIAIEATWRWSNDAPLIQYTVRHPSYAGRRFYCTAEGARFRQ